MVLSSEKQNIYCYYSNFGTSTGFDQGGVSGEDASTDFGALQCAMRGCLQKAIAVRPNTILFLLHCGAKPSNYGLVLACFSLSCNPNVISLNCPIILCLFCCMNWYSWVRVCEGKMGTPGVK